MTGRNRSGKDAQMSLRELRASSFGPDFLWGVAQSSFQTEGAWDADGKSPSCWDTFSQRRGTVRNNDNGNVACDFYHRYPEDIRRMREMGFRALRFSLSWPRILSRGTGRVNPKGIDFYSRLVDTCLENGIQPWINLYHWDHPQVLEDRGGWTNRDMNFRFEEYAHVCATRFSDRVSNWMTINEPIAMPLVGYLAGIFPPGRRSLTAFWKAYLNSAIAQGLAAKAIQGANPSNRITTIFPTICHQPLRPDHAGDVTFASQVDHLVTGFYVDLALGRGIRANRLPFFARRVERYLRDGDLERCAYRVDFMGINYYTRIVWKSLPLPFAAGLPVGLKRLGVAPEDVTQMGYQSYPEGIYQVIRQWASLGIPLYITENGSACEDARVEGRVRDVQRKRAYQEHLKQVLRAKDEGADIRGYFAWSYMDNFEWHLGYGVRFGLVHVDYATQERIIKDSGRWMTAFLNQ